MRLHLKLSPNSQLIPFDYQRFLVGAFHKWIGENEVHNELSLYSFSWLKNGDATRKGLNFRYGSSWFISAADENLIKQVLKGITHSPEIYGGMGVKEVMIQETPVFGHEHRFLVNSPVLVKTWLNDEYKHLGFNDIEADSILTSILQLKLERAGIENDSLEVFFDRNYAGAKQKLVNYRGIGNKANICPVIIRGTPEQIGFAWNVGIGHSTGIGFGALN